MKLIYDIETSSPEVQITESLNEQTGKTEKKYKIKGIFSTIGEKNRNNRIYPRDLWEREVANYQNEIANGTINTLCEWEHPARNEVDPMKAVAKINKLYIEGKYVMGEAVILDNEDGQRLKTLIDNGVKISVSSRGTGSVGKNNIVESFKLITYDLVASPSDYNATMNGLVEGYRLVEGILQGKEFHEVNGNIEEIKPDTLNAPNTLNEVTKQSEPTEETKPTVGSAPTAPTVASKPTEPTKPEGDKMVTNEEIKSLKEEILKETKECIKDCIKDLKEEILKELKPEIKAETKPDGKTLNELGIENKVNESTKQSPEIEIKNFIKSLSEM